MKRPHSFMTSIATRISARLAAIVVTLLTLQAQAGGVGNVGGGTFVQTPSSPTLVFWDLYINDPNFSERAPGDQLAPRTDIPHSATPGDWVDYRKLQSFKYLKSRLSLWQFRARKLVNNVTNNGILLRNGGPGEPEGFYMLLVGTSLPIQHLDEIKVPRNIDTRNLRAYPGAHFDKDTERVFVMDPVFNRAGLVSQAAMLFHEFLRNVQLDYNISNSQLQKIVYTILVRDPNEVSEADYDDNIFSPLQYAPSRTIFADPRLSDGSTSFGRMLFKQEPELKAYEVEFQFDCEANHRKPGQTLNDQWDSAIGGYIGTPTKAAPWVPVCKAPANADQEVQKALKKGVLGTSAPPIYPLVSSGTNNTRDVFDRTPLSPQIGTVLDANNCNEVLKVHRDRTYFNSMRSALGCDQGLLGGSGPLYFESPMTYEFNVEVTAHLYTQNDGGSTIAVDVMGLEVHIANNGILTANSNMVRISERSITADRNSFHKYVFRYLLAQKRVEVVFNDDGNYKSNAPIAVFEFRREIPQLSKIDWVYRTENLSTVSSIRILP